MLADEYPLTNYLTGAEYILRPVLSELVIDSQIDQLVSICNEAPIYDILFKEKLQNQPYAQNDAKKFFEWGAKGWKEQTYFVYLIVSELGEIAAAIDLKSADKNFAEVGYWSSGKHRGVMSNAMCSLIRIAQNDGYQKLYAKVRKANFGSQKVLINNQFVKDEEWQEDPIRYRFIREIAHTNAID